MRRQVRTPIGNPFHIFLCKMMRDSRGCGVKTARILLFCIRFWMLFCVHLQSPPARGAWVEIVVLTGSGTFTTVAPRTGGVG